MHPIFFLGGGRVCLENLIANSKQKRIVGNSCIWVLCFSTAIQGSQDYPRLFMLVHRHSLVSCFQHLISFRAHFAGKIWNDRDRNGSVQSLAWIKITGKIWWLFSCIIRNFIKHSQQEGNLFRREEKCLWTRLPGAWPSVKPLIMEWYSQESRIIIFQYMVIRLLIWKNFMEESEIVHSCVMHTVDDWNIWIHYELFVSSWRHHLRKVQWWLQKLVVKYLDSTKANLF